MKKLFTVALIALSVMACQTTPPALPAPNTKLETVVKADATAIAPLPDKIEGLDLDKVALGDKLFHDTRLSKDNTVSCASCHGLDTGGVDRLPRSKGVGGVEGGVNSPTVFNSSFNFVQFWDGRAKDLHEQAGGPVMNPKEMGSANWDEVIAKLKADPEYVEKFAKIYTDGLTGNNIQDAIATFEKTLITPNSRFDKYLKGDKTALTQEELKGWELFQGYSCTTCHNGINIGGNSFQKFGLVRDYLTDVRGNVTETDFGRFNVSKDEADKFKFKVPSLRTAAITAPYFHDASAKTLEDAITIMGRHQLGIEFQPGEIKALAAFIRSLVGEYKGQLLK